MLLTIHNLPSSTRYADVKSLLKDKCGLTEVIVDNLVNEGKSKKVTVGLATEDDGAFVVRKLNGLLINGQQLYIEDKRRSTADQPYRPGGLDPVQPSPMMQPVMAPMVPSWNQTVAMPYMQPMAVDQTLAYTGYVGVTQAPLYAESNPVSAQVPGYSGYQPEAYAPNTEPRNQEPGDWNRNSREKPSETFRNKDRKRRHSPEKPDSGKRMSRFDNFNKSKNRNPTPPPKQWADENRAFRDQFSRQNQHAEPPYQPKEPNSDYRQSDSMWEQQSRWEDPKPAAEQQWGNANRGWEPEPQSQWREEPRQWDNQPKPQWESPPKAQWDNRAKSQRDKQPRPHRNNEPKSQWNTPQKSQWDNQPKPQWDSPPKSRWDNQPAAPQWDNPQKPHWDNQPKPQWDHQPKPQWDDRVPVENIRSEWYDHLAASDAPRGNDQEFQPRDHDRNRDGRSRNQNFDEPINDQVWTREPKNSFSSSDRQSRPAEESRRNRPRSKNGRERNDWRDSRPVSPRDRSGGRERTDYGKPKEYPSREFRRHPKPEHGPPKPAPRQETNRYERVEAHGANAKSNFTKQKNTYPPVSDRPVNKPGFVEVRLDKNKPQTLRSMINKDQTIRLQATALIAKKTVGADIEKPYISKGPLEAYIYKQLKACIKSRVDVIFGEELSVNLADVIQRYRAKFPFKDDSMLMVQIREKSSRELESLPPKEKKIEAYKHQAKAEQDEAEKQKRENNTTASPKVEQSNQGVTKAKVAQSNQGAAKVAQNNQGVAKAKVPQNKQGTANAKNGTQNIIVAPAAAKIAPPVHPSIAKMNKKKPGAPLTDKQVIQQMKLLRKWEYDQDDIYSMDADSTKALDDEMAQLDKLFTDECLNPADQHESVICKLLTSDCLNDFHKTIRLYITKRILNIQTGLAVRMFATGKPPKKEAVLQYLKKNKIQAAAVKKSVKGGMFMVNLTRFQDFDKLCNLEKDVIDGVPISFKAMHLAGPPAKVTKNQIKSMRQKMIANQIDGLDMNELEDVDFGTGDRGDGAGDKLEGAGDKWEGAEDQWENGGGDQWEAGNADGDGGDTSGNMDTGFVAEEDFTEDDFPGEDFSKQNKETEDAIDFAEGVNIENIKEEDLEDF
ncbi:uncharacterized protein LOC125237173 [Leguminivora glycinivorella]|uniref:uncharacterized protein LOC125237173 n=1 Tax=Leguminivora glycinivorella TaxID=1035111 RepID=UPI00200C57D9|nr:uncharacterized protein LOC125237173 [Leguminivora glycinivorella]